MSSVRQIQANRRNALKSTGPVTLEGKERSRCNAVRHGLTAETVIGALEDAEDYKAFEAAVIADYEAESAVERELVLRLASLLWRLRRATSIETGLFERQLERLSGARETSSGVDPVVAVLERVRRANLSAHGCGSPDATTCFVELTKDPTYPLDRLSRYEAILWRQAGQIIFTLDVLGQRRSRTRGRYNFWRLGPTGRSREF
jgi:hypothetical protein